jgi:hypothetical protein
MIIERRFHAVGQGAFYSEVHFYHYEPNNQIFTVVYDCGSMTDSKLIPKRIKEDFNQPNVSEKDKLAVDILFISHFHEDHINGCKYLAPSLVIIPDMDEDDILLTQIQSLVDDEPFNADSARHPEHLFPEAKIVRVRKDYAEGEGERPSEPIDLDRVRNMGSIPSGALLQSRIRGEKYWGYLPFNFDNKSKQFIAAIAEKFGEDLPTFRANLPRYLKDAIKKKQLKSIYSKLHGKINESSMILVSAPLFEYSLLYNEDFGCIYTGDLTITPQIARALKRRMRAYPQMTHHIKTFQIPHHGSDHSFSNRLLYLFDHWYRDCVISVGEKNQFHHPSLTLLNKLIQFEKQVHLVTEDRSTRFLEWNFY